MPTASEMAAMRSQGAGTSALPSAPKGNSVGGGPAQDAVTNFQENIALLKSNPREVGPVFAGFKGVLDQLFAQAQGNKPAANAPASPSSSPVPPGQSPPAPSAPPARPPTPPMG